MKKVLIIISAALFFSTASNAQVTLAVRAGVNLQNIVGKEANGDFSKNGVIPCMNAGVLVNLPVGIDFAVQTGLIFAQKGSKITDQFQNATRVQNVQLSYIELPVNFVFSPIVGSGNLLLGFGPYFAYAIGGKVINQNTEAKSDIQFQNEVNVGETGTAYFKPMDIGGNFFFGYEINKHLQIQFNAQISAVEINPKDNRIVADKTIKKNAGFGISVGWKI